MEIYVLSMKLYSCQLGKKPKYQGRVSPELKVHPAGVILCPLSLVAFSLMVPPSSQSSRSSSLNIAVPQQNCVWHCLASRIALNFAIVVSRFFADILTISFPSSLRKFRGMCA